MGKGNGKRRDPLAEHKRQGKVLVAPFNTLPGLSLNSWLDQRFPEMLWVALALISTDRKTALGNLRVAAKWLSRRIALGLTPGTGLTAIAALPVSERRDFIRLVSHSLFEPYAFAPMLLLSPLPAYEDWRVVLGLVPDLSDWDLLKVVTTENFDHQSELATDTRWFKVFAMTHSGKLQFPIQKKAIVKEILGFPYVGDLRQVRPTIRSTEPLLDQITPDHQRTIAQWATAFWSYVYQHTAPTRGHLPKGEPMAVPAALLDRLNNLRQTTATHYTATQPGTPNKERDAAFGLVFAPLHLIRHVVATGVHQSILGVFALRFVVESAINLHYLASKKDPELWKAFIDFGLGQAKLIRAKHERDEAVGTCVDTDYLGLIVDENRAEMFVDVNLGDWSRTNLRDRASEGGVKGLYDLYYDYASTINHATWAGIVPLAFDYDVNPLHRLRKLPRSTAPVLRSMVEDAVKVIDRSHSTLLQLYPLQTQTTPSERAPTQVETRSSR